MSDIAIKVSNLSKCYQDYEQPHDRLKQSICPRLQQLAGKPGASANQEWLWAVPAARTQGKSILMKSTPLAIPDVMLIDPKVFSDIRAYFFESYNEQAFFKLIGRQVNFVQDNHSESTKGVLRGFHCQIKQPSQGKLVRVVQGEVFDVAADIRKGSPTFGQWSGVKLSAENKQQLRIPKGFARGFVSLSGTAEFLYKATDYYASEYERCFAWNDIDIGIDWIAEGQPILSEKNQQGVSLKDAEDFT